jgi:hypothetical protein
MGGLSGKLLEPDAIGSFVERDLGVLAVADIAAKDTCAFLPAHPVAGTPGRGYPGRRYPDTSRVSLACLPGLAAGQACCT